MPLDLTPYTQQHIDEALEHIEGLRYGLPTNRLTRQLYYELTSAQEAHPTPGITPAERAESAAVWKMYKTLIRRGGR